MLNASGGYLMGNPDKLETWAQIESYLGMNRVTILRQGYPIRKFAKVVFAYPDALDAHQKKLESNAEFVSGPTPPEVPNSLK